MTVLVLGDRDVGCRKIQDDCGTGSGSTGRRRDRHPEILADLHKEGKPAFLLTLKENSLPERNLSLAHDFDGRTVCREGGSKLPVFVKLTIIRQKRLGNDS